MAEEAAGRRNTQSQDFFETPELKRLGTLIEITRMMAGGGADGGVGSSTMTLK